MMRELNFFLLPGVLVVGGPMMFEFVDDEFNKED